MNDSISISCFKSALVIRGQESQALELKAESQLFSQLIKVRQEA
jgi:hypothetical protein